MPSPSAPPTVRSATAADTDEVLRVVQLMYDALDMNVPGVDWRPPAARMMATRLGTDMEVVVAEDPHRPGHLVATGAGTWGTHLPTPGNPSGRTGYIQWMSTEPAWQRRGLARRVMEALLAWYEDRDVRSVELHASDMGEPLYRDLGFVGLNHLPLRRRW